MNETEKIFDEYFKATGETVPLAQLRGMSDEEIQDLIEESIRTGNPIETNEELIY